MLNLQGPDGRQVMQRVVLKEEAFSGPMTDYGPDMLIGYAPGYRASSETGLGKWSAAVVETNPDHWEADHCIDSQAVPGVIFLQPGIARPGAPILPGYPLADDRQTTRPKLQPRPPKPPTSAGSEDK